LRAGTAGTGTGAGAGTETADEDVADDDVENADIADADVVDDGVGEGGAGAGGGAATRTWRLIGSAPDGGRTLPDGVFVVGSIDASTRMGDGAGVAIVQVMSDDATALSVASAVLNSSAV